MDKLEKRWLSPSSYPRLHPEIKEYLSPWDPESRERIAKIALEKMEGVESTDLAARVTEAVESVILGVLHKGIDEQMRGYMN
jgi:hypothetical protein